MTDGRPEEPERWLGQQYPSGPPLGRIPMREVISATSSILDRAAS